MTSNVDTSRAYRIRTGRPSDADELAELNAAVQLQELTGGRPHPGIAAWTRSLLEGHPTVRQEHFLVAEHLPTARIVAGLVGIRQTWACGQVTGQHLERPKRSPP